MSTIHAESTITELIEALDQYATRKGWQDIQLTLSPDGICCLMEPNYAPVAENDIEAGELCGFEEWQSCTSIEELCDFLAEGEERAA